MSAREALEPAALDPSGPVDGDPGNITKNEVELSKAISLKRIADSLERIGECADGIHPSAFRVIKQEG